MYGKVEVGLRAGCLYGKVEVGLRAGCLSLAVEVGRYASYSDWVCRLCDCGEVEERYCLQSFVIALILSGKEYFTLPCVRVYLIKQPSLSLRL